MSKYKSFSDEKRIAANILLARGENWQIVAERMGHSHMTLRRYCNPTVAIDEALKQFAEDMKLLARRLESMPGVWKGRAVDVRDAAEILSKWSTRCGETNGHHNPSQTRDHRSGTAGHALNGVDGSRVV